MASRTLVVLVDRQQVGRRVVADPFDVDVVTGRDRRDDVAFRQHGARPCGADDQQQAEVVAGQRLRGLAERGGRGRSWRRAP